MIRAELRDDCVARCPIFDTYSHFDQFVMRECRLKFRKNRVRQTAVANHEQGLELVAKAAQIFFL